MHGAAPQSGGGRQGLGAAGGDGQIRMMKLTILEAGRAPGALASQFPSYPAMFERLLSGADAGLTFETVRLLDGEALPDPARLEAALITGSPAGVYDQTPWMDPLRTFVRKAHAAKTPMVGVCFGHQIMSDALGGVVRKSEKGWGVGLHTYEVLDKRSWMADAPAAFSLAASHQDQVITPPAGAVTIARSAHTDHAMLHWLDAPMMSLQGHPEFADDFSAALYGARRDGSLGEVMADAAIASLARPADGARVAVWMARFLRETRRDQ